MGFVLIIFSDLQRSSIVKMIKFKKMKDMITFTDNKVKVEPLLSAFFPLAEREEPYTGWKKKISMCL
jgi:hypothetical protein